MENLQNEIKDIIIDEFSKVIDAIESDFPKNYSRKVNNFLLSQMDKRIIANMVFVSSFESRSGFAIESCARKITRLKFGKNNVPAKIDFHNIDVKNAVKSPEAGQIVITTVDTNNAELRGKIAAFRQENVARGSGKNRIESGITQESIQFVCINFAK